MNSCFIAGIIFLGFCGCSLAQNSSISFVPGPDHQLTPLTAPKLQGLEAAWEKHILEAARNRYCDTEMGEDIGWLIAPFLDGFYYGYMASGETKWLDLEVDWLDSWIKRQVIEPDGYPGWPKLGAAGTDADELTGYYADSLAGEAMVLRAAVQMSNEILKSPSLKSKYGPKAVDYIIFAEQMYEKWNSRGTWRDTEDGGTISVVLPFGIDKRTGKWTAGYAIRNAPGQGLSHPNSRANLTACWLLAMYDATKKVFYRDRAERWFKIMKSRMKLKEHGRYELWNYWQPASAWDFKPDGSTKEWVGIHPNEVYYSIDVEGIVAAIQHGLVFKKEDIEHLVATALTEKRYWKALVPYDTEIQRRFEESLTPDSREGLSAVPWYLTMQRR